MTQPVKGRGFRAAPTVTRPANTTGYSAGAVIGNGPNRTDAVIEFANIGGSGEHIIITGADLLAYINAVPSGQGSMRLYLYDAIPASAYANGAAWDLPAGDRPNFLGYIDIGSLVDMGSTCHVQYDGVNKQVKLADGSASLWGYLVTANAFTPAANSEVYVPRLRAVSV